MNQDIYINIADGAAVILRGIVAALYAVAVLTAAKYFGTYHLLWWWVLLIFMMPYAKADVSDDDMEKIAEEAADLVSEIMIEELQKAEAENKDGEADVSESR